MADGIRGKSLDAFPPDVQKAYMLHRAIDILQMRILFLEKVLRNCIDITYAGVIVDV
jgi:acyl carrier protein phosphodiesterase